MKNFMKHAHYVGVLLVIWFIICFAWFYIHPVEQMMHMQLLRLSFFYFSGMNVMSFISGAIQSYIWGYIAVGTWMLACKLAKLPK